MNESNVVFQIVSESIINYNTIILKYANVY